MTRHPVKAEAASPGLPPFPRPGVTVDCCVFGFDAEGLKVLLIQREIEPFAGRWALPGGFVHEDENLEQAALRELAEETGARDVFLDQVGAFGDLGRDPRGRVVTILYYALVRPGAVRLQASTDARNAAWFLLEDTPALAFDHAHLMKCAHERLCQRVRREPVGFELLPPKFSLGQLQSLYETILNRPLDKRNFRRSILASGVVKPLEEFQSGVPHRAARLFRFDEREYRRLVKAGGNFDLG